MPHEAPRTAAQRSEDKAERDGRKRRGRRPKPPSLAKVDLSKSLSERTYRRRLAELQDRLRLINQAYVGSKQCAVVVFEGWDAAGKGGAIRRIAWAMDPRGLKVWPIGAPRAYFKQRHYLQRFWEKLPADGQVVIFDRSWYGRVLVERVEGFATEAEWSRAYEEINQFEHLLHDDGTRLIKFFLHISDDEQLKRFRARLEEPHKRWKLTAEDFRNRSKRDAYSQAIDDMLAKTHRPEAPWHVVPAENKKFARIRIIETLCERLSEGLDLAPTPLSDDLLSAATDALHLSREQQTKLQRRA